MTNDELVQALRENANALRRVACRPTINAIDEEALRGVAVNIDNITLEFATRAKAGVGVAIAVDHARAAKDDAMRTARIVLDQIAKRSKDADSRALAEGALEVMR
jgi:hypothetical protein